MFKNIHTSIKMAAAILSLFLCNMVQAADFYTYTLVNSSDASQGYKVALSSSFKTQVNKASGGSFTDDNGNTWVTGDPLPAFNTDYTVTSLASVFNGCSTMTSLDLSLWDVSNVTTLYRLFYNCSNLATLKGLDGWNVSNVTDMSYLFYYCSALTSCEGLTNWETSSVTDMSYLFYFCTALTTIEGLENWKTSSVTNLKYTFYSCSALTSLSGLEEWDVSKVTTMYCTFFGCHSLTALTPLANWNVSSVTTLYGTFTKCYGLTSLSPLSNWANKTSKLTNLQATFSLCYGLSSLTGLEEWDVSNVTSMYRTFYDCYGLSSLTGLEEWDVSKVTTLLSTFQYCSSLTDLSPLANWNVSSVTSLNSTFYGCSSLTSLTGLANWNVSSVTSLNSTFYGCTALSDLTALANWDTSTVGNLSSTFFNTSTNAVGIYDLSGWDFTTSNVTRSSDMFYGVSSNVSDASSVGYAKDLKKAAWYMARENVGNITFTEPLSTSAGLGTYCADTYHNYEIYNNDTETQDTCQLRAYTAKMVEGNIILTPTTHVRAGEGILLRSVYGTLDDNFIGEAHNVKCLLVPDYKYEDNTDNQLIGVTEDTPISQTETDENGVTYCNLVLSRSGSNYRFYKVPSAGTTIPAGRAYLHCKVSDMEVSTDTGTESVQAVSLSFSDDSGEATGIGEVILQETAATGDAGGNQIYNLSGQKKSSATRGINIINGKKVAVM